MHSSTAETKMQKRRGSLLSVARSLFQHRDMQKQHVILIYFNFIQSLAVFEAEFCVANAINWMRSAGARRSGALPALGLLLHGPQAYLPGTMARYHGYHSGRPAVSAEVNGRDRRRAPRRPFTPTQEDAPKGELGCPHFGRCSGCTLANGLGDPSELQLARSFFADRQALHAATGCHRLRGAFIPRFRSAGASRLFLWCIQRARMAGAAGPSSRSGAGSAGRGSGCSVRALTR